MKKIIILCGAMVLSVGDTFADCTENLPRQYTSCKAGYYYNSTAKTCTRCPSSGGIYGTTVDKNTGDITSCYIPSGTTFRDMTGSGTYTGNCYYSN